MQRKFYIPKSSNWDAAKILCFTVLYIYICCVLVTDMVQRKTLVLDLDETLIHSHHDGVLRQTVKPGTPPDFVLKVSHLPTVRPHSHWHEYQLRVIYTSKTRTSGAYKHKHFWIAVWWLKIMFTVKQISQCLFCTWFVCEFLAVSIFTGLSCILQVTIDRHPVRFFVHKRPHVDYFLDVVSIWTRCLLNYINSVKNGM